MNPEKCRIGRVKFYDANKEFGFVEELTDPTQEDVYFNRSAVELTLPVDGELVLFRPEAPQGNSQSRSSSRVFLIGEAPFPDRELRELASAIPNEEARRLAKDAIHAGPSVLRTYLIDRLWMVGRVKFFDSEKGFGFIRPLRKQEVGGDDVYVHESSLLSQNLSDGDRVAFRPIRSRSKSGSVEAAHVHPVTSFSGNPAVLRELLVEDLLDGGRSLHSLHIATLQGLGSKERENYTRQVLKHLDRKQEEDVATTLSTLKDRLESTVSDGSIDDVLLQVVRQKAGQLAKEGKIPPREQVELFSKGVAPPPSPDVLDDILADKSAHRQKSIATKLSGSELEEYASYASESAKSAKVSGELREQFERFSRITANANVDEAIVQRVEDRIGRTLRDVVEEGRLDPSDVADLWMNGILDSIPANILAEAIRGMKSSEAVSSLKRLAPDELLQVVEHRTAALLSEDSSSDRVERITSWFNALHDLTETNFGGTQKLESGEEEERSQERALRLATSKVKEACTVEEKAYLYARGFLDSLPEDWVKEHVSTLPKDILSQVLAREQTTERFRKNVLEASTAVVSSENITLEEEQDEAGWIAEQIYTHFTDQTQTRLLENLVAAVRPETHLELWKDGIIGILPERALNRYFESPSVEDIRQAAEWWKEGLLPKDELSHRLDRYLQGLPNRVHPEVYPSVREGIVQLANLKELIDERLGKYAPAVQQMAMVALWREKDSDIPDLETIQAVFPALPSEKQIRTLRRLFYLHATNELSLDVTDVSRLSGLDLDSLGEGRIREDQLPAALTPEIVVKTLQKVDREGELLLEGERLKIALQTARVRDGKEDLGPLFDQCTGRTKIQFKPGATHYDDHSSSNGPDQKKIVEKEEGGRRYFEIQFRYSEYLVQKVKKLPDREYNPETEVWSVPATKKGRREVKKFAKQNTFFLEINENDGDVYKNNPHLSKLEENEFGKPCNFCEGRYVGKHPKWRKKYWWCRSGKCFRANHKTRSPEDWEQYTLLDFISLLGLGGKLEYEDYSRYMGVLNRFDQLLSRLKCRECGQYMHPVKDSAFAHYRVTRFHCVNDGCSNHEVEVYLHHCLNSACSSVIDSRDTEQCPNGWWICTSENCGACCSTETMKKRRDRLQGAQQQPSSQLQRFISQKKGHIERAEHFCYSCGERMVWLREINERLFRCENCEIEYDTSSADFSYRNSEKRSEDDPDRLEKAMAQHEALHEGR